MLLFSVLLLLTLTELHSATDLPSVPTSAEVPLLAGGAASQPALSATQQPIEASQSQQILEKAREYADNYIERLPNFICKQRTDQFQGDKKAAKWKQGDTVESKLIYSGGKERRTLEAVNGKVPGPNVRHGVRRPLTTEGEFGVLLANVAGSGSQAEFHSEGFQSLGGKNLAVFSYSMSRDHSTMKLSRSDLAQAVVPYYGKLFVDPDNGQVWRISNEATDIPEDLDTRSIATVVNYSNVTIGNANYLMPLQATVLMTTKSGSIRNELSFSAFQKFETGSTITFGESSGGTPTPNTPSPPPQ